MSVTINITTAKTCCRMLNSRVRNMAQGIGYDFSRLENGRC